MEESIAQAGEAIGNCLSSLYHPTFRKSLHVGGFYPVPPPFLANSAWGTGRETWGGRLQTWEEPRLSVLSPSPHLRLDSCAEGGAGNVSPESALRPPPTHEGAWAPASGRYQRRPQAASLVASGTPRRTPTKALREVRLCGGEGLRVQRPHPPSALSFIPLGGPARGRETRAASCPRGVAGKKRQPRWGLRNHARDWAGRSWYPKRCGDPHTPRA